jgi:hypothetical protein
MSMVCIFGLRHFSDSRTSIFFDQKSEREILDLPAALRSLAIRSATYLIDRLDLRGPTQFGVVNDELRVIWFDSPGRNF